MTSNVGVMNRVFARSRARGGAPAQSPNVTSGQRRIKSLSWWQVKKLKSQMVSGGVFAKWIYRLLPIPDPLWQAILKTAVFLIAGPATLYTFAILTLSFIGLIFQGGNVSVPFGTDLLAIFAMAALCASIVSRLILSFPTWRLGQIKDMTHAHEVLPPEAYAVARDIYVDHPRVIFKVERYLSDPFLIAILPGWLKSKFLYVFHWDE